MAKSTSTALNQAWEPPTTRRENNAPHARVERTLLSAAVDLALALDFFNSSPDPGPSHSPKRRQAPDHHPRSDRKRHHRNPRRKDYSRRRVQLCHHPQRSKNNRRHRHDHLSRPDRFREDRKSTRL